MFVRFDACASLNVVSFIFLSVFEWEEREGRPAGVFTGPKTHKQPWFVHFK